ncbi:hypothetical protein LguiB_022892 [Lonicera macranthoides]
MVSAGDRSEIAFFDLETSFPTRPGQGFTILEFGSILVCPRKLIELESYSTLVRPTDLSFISNLSIRGNGITRDAVLSSPTFAQIADTVHDILDGRIWAGHNIVRFDCARIREAFAEINRPPPLPKGTIDSLALLTQSFGRRAGDMKMASIATYFGLRKQTHRSLDDVRLNLEILKYCATVLFLESSFPNIFTTNSWVSPNATTRSRSNGKAFLELTGLSTSPSSSSSLEIRNNRTSPPPNYTIEESHPIFSLATPGTGEEVPNPVESIISQPNAFDMGSLSSIMANQLVQTDRSMEEESGSKSPKSSTALTDCADFLECDEVSISSITVALVPVYRGTQRIQILHKDYPFKVRRNRLKVRFGVSSKYLDNAGRPRLSFVVDAPPNLCCILDKCDNLAHKLSLDSGSNSDWRPILARKAGFWNSPTIRLQIPFESDGNTRRWATEIHLKESSSIERIVFSRYDAEELDGLIRVGTFVDAYFNLDPYDYQQNAGVRLVAKNTDDLGLNESIHMSISRMLGIKSRKRVCC